VKLAPFSHHFASFSLPHLLLLSSLFLSSACGSLVGAFQMRPFFIFYLDASSSPFPRVQRERRDRERGRGVRKEKERERERERER
jgi:hypothetical protein